VELLRHYIDIQIKVTKVLLVVWIEDTSMNGIPE